MPSDKDTFEIRYGKSGGFTNIPMEYKIDANGDIFKILNSDTLKIDSVSGRKIKKIKHQLTELDFEHLEINDPGNITYFINVCTGTYQNTVKWNDMTDNEPLKMLYKGLLKKIKP